MKTVKLTDFEITMIELALDVAENYMKLRVLQGKFPSGWTPEHQSGLAEHYVCIRAKLTEALNS